MSSTSSSFNDALGASPRSRRQIASAAIAATLVVVGVLGWRWSSAAAALTSNTTTMSPAEADQPAAVVGTNSLEVAVLDVRTIQRRAPETAVAPAAVSAIITAPASPTDFAPARPTSAEQVRVTPAVPARPVRRVRQQPPRPKLVTRPVEVRVELRSAPPPNPEEQRPAPAPAKPPTPQKPDAPLESNPYVYK